MAIRRAITGEYFSTEFNILEKPFSKEKPDSFI
jgi:hypothetical protein